MSSSKASAFLSPRRHPKRLKSPFTTELVPRPDLPSCPVRALREYLQIRPPAVPMSTSLSQPWLNPPPHDPPRPSCAGRDGWHSWRWVVCLATASESAEKNPANNVGGIHRQEGCHRVSQWFSGALNRRCGTEPARKKTRRFSDRHSGARSGANWRPDTRQRSVV